MLKELENILQHKNIRTLSIVYNKELKRKEWRFD